MKNGKCPKCNLSHVYFKEYALDGKGVEYVNYICTACGYFETCITDKDALSKIITLAGKSGDWKKAK